MVRKFLVLVVLLAAVASARSADKPAEKPKPPADREAEAEVARLRKQLALEKKRIALLLEEKKELREVADLLRLQQAKETARLIKEREALREQLLKEKEALRKRLTAAEIEARAQHDHVRRLEQKLQALAREVARLKAGGPVRPVVVNPPKENVEGVIARIEAKGLVKVSVGSDAGLAVGHTLEVFRLGATPKYLGRIRIVSVKPKEAVGQVVGRLMGPLEKGDRVASRILGK